MTYRKSYLGNKVSDFEWYAIARMFAQSYDSSLTIEEVEQHAGEHLPDEFYAILHDDDWFDRSKVLKDEKDDCDYEFDDHTHPEYVIAPEPANTPRFFPKVWKGFQVGRSIIDYKDEYEPGLVLYTSSYFVPVYGTDRLGKAHEFYYLTPPDKHHTDFSTNSEEVFEFPEVRRVTEEEAKRIKERYRFG